MNLYLRWYLNTPSYPRLQWRGLTEAMCQRRGCIPTAIYPRLQRRGLTEACPHRSRSGRPPASYPRLQWRGLTEAW